MISLGNIMISSVSRTVTLKIPQMFAESALCHSRHELSPLFGQFSTSDEKLLFSLQTYWQE